MAGKKRQKKKQKQDAVDRISGKFLVCSTGFH